MGGKKWVDLDTCTLYPDRENPVLGLTARNKWIERDEIQGRWPTEGPDGWHYTTSFHAHVWLRDHKRKREPRYPAHTVALPDTIWKPANRQAIANGVSITAVIAEALQKPNLLALIAQAKRKQGK